MSLPRRWDLLRSSAPTILPSLLLCDFGNLEREVHRLQDAGIRGLHLDVMDGHFVPNLTYGLPIVQALRRLTDLPLDVHLMISNPENYIDRFVHAGADVITIHIEATDRPLELLHQIRSCGVACGIALNPGTLLTGIEPLLDVCDLVLVMSVDAGFGGQEFKPVALDKLRMLEQSKPPHIMLEVDGGINPATISKCAAAGADLFVIGSAIFRQPDYSVAVKQLASLVTST
jgi:ribulose-phosphate 3-epimerase